MRGLTGEKSGNIADKAWEFITEINPGEVQMTDTINSLTDEYQNYCSRHGLPLLSANELLGKLTELDNPSEVRRERDLLDDQFHQPLGRR